MEIPRISCIAVAGRDIDIRHFPFKPIKIGVFFTGEFIAVGSEDGRIRLFTRNWAPVYNARHLAVSVNSLTFIDSN